jgi:hypothetical protein
LIISYKKTARSSENIGNLVIKNKKAKKRNQRSFAADGFVAIMNESVHSYRCVLPEEIDTYGKNVLSLTSVVDVMQLIQHKELLERKTKIIAGGQGCVNIQTYKDYVDVVNWGRCDGLLDRIIDGQRDDSCIDVTDFDPNKRYQMRQVSYLYPNEVSVGCRMKCRFCQYSHTRKLLGSNYNHGKDLEVYEDNFFSFDVSRPGFYMTALDGLSEKSRFLVNKKITDDFIAEKIGKIIKKKFEKTVIIKLFQIVGYPWETEESVMFDLHNLKKLFRRADCKGGRVYIKMSFTPFSPEPITPMAKLPVDLTFYWRDVFEKHGRCLYKSDNLEVLILPYVLGPQTTLQRVMINRGAPADLVIGVGNEKRNGRPWKDFMSGIYSKYDVHGYTQRQEHDVNIDSYLKFEYM